MCVSRQAQLASLVLPSLPRVALHQRMLADPSTWQHPRVPPQPPQPSQRTCSPVGAKWYLSWCRCFHLRKYLGASSCSGRSGQDQGNKARVSAGARHSRGRAGRQIDALPSTCRLQRCTCARTSRPHPIGAHARSCSSATASTQISSAATEGWYRRAWKMWSRISSLLTSRPCRPAVTAA